MIGNLWWTVAFAATPPTTAALDWRGGASTLRVVPPPGFHVSEDAPGDLSLTWADHALTVSVPGAEAAVGFPLGDLRGQTVSGELAVSVCDDAGTTCRRASFAFFGAVPAEKKGSVALINRSSVAPPPVSVAAPHVEAPPEAAFTAAAGDGGLVLLDFTAVWCPPCNQLAAEVLHAEDAASVLAGFHLATVDVDRAESWTLKDRYDVGGYPTIVAARADGTEVSRMVGYDSRDAFVAWLADARSGGLSGRAARDPGAVPPPEAAEVALALIRADAGDPAPWLARAAESPEQPTFRVARLAHAPTPEDARWLAAHGVSARLWVRDALPLVGADATLAATLAEALLADAPRDTSDAADRLEVLAELLPEQAPVLYPAAAQVLRAGFTGDPALDRAYYTWYADLLEKSRQVDVAVAFLADARAQFPQEMTWDLAAGRILTRAGRADEALARLDAARAVAWGDNRLRVDIARVEALVALGRPKDALQVAQDALLEFPEPPEGVEVRTTRYRQQLRAAAGL